MDKSESKLKTTFQKIKSIKHIEIIIAVAAVIIMVIIYFTTLGSSSTKGKTDTDKVNVSNYCDKMKNEIVETVASMCGGTPTVAIGWESSVESVIAYVTNTTTNGSTSTPQLITSQGSSSPIVLKEIYPKAIGVVVICQGGDSVKTKLDIISEISILLNLSPERINVFPSKK